MKAFEGQDAIISTVGAAAFLDQKVLIDAAIKAKVQRFIPSEFSSNTQSAAVRDLVPVFEAKLEVMRYLEEKEATGLSWTGLSVGPLFDWVSFRELVLLVSHTDIVVVQGLKSGFLGFDIAGKKARVWDEGSVVFSATNQDDVARALIAILQKPQETANRFLYVETVAASQAEILKSLETATGHSWLVERVKTSDLVAAGRKQVAVGDFTGNFPLVQASVWGDWDGLRSNYSVDEALSNTLLGLAHGRLDSLIGSILASLGEN